MNNEIKELKQKVKNLKVIYVEDEDDMRMGTEIFLNKFFTNVTIAVDGKEGLDKFEENNFDVVFTDILMPNMNGLEMVENIKKIESDVFIVTLTASDVEKEEIEKSVDLYFRKPISYENMFTIMNEIVNKFKL
jgi:CheY-like chemotaxis protein